MKILSKLLCAVTALLILTSLAACKTKSDGNDTTETDTEQSLQAQVYGENTDGYSGSQGYTPNGGDTPNVQGGNNNNNENSNGGNAADPQAEQNPQVTDNVQSSVRETVRVTIPEGYTLTQIFTKLEQNGVCSFDKLMETAQSYDYSYYPLIAARPNNTRAFKLEGYLFPSTYEFYKNEKPQDAIGRFLRAAESKITQADRARAAQMGYSMDQILTVASIIEKEGANPAEVSKIAAIVYNRLEKGMKLQMDSGIVYIEKRVKPFISGDINRYNSLYNMNKCAALPAGPICNPGRTTINAALHPADVSYLFFCHDKNAKYYYADTYEEHLENLKKAGID